MNNIPNANPNDPTSNVNGAQEALDNFDINTVPDQDKQGAVSLFGALSSRLTELKNKTSDDEVGTSANNLVGQNSTVENQATVTSAGSARDQVAKRFQDIPLPAPLTGAERTQILDGDPVLGLLDERQQTLRERFLEDKQGIEEDFDRKEDELKTDQAGEQGTFRNSLLRIGGFLGGSASHVTSMNKLAETHRKEVLELQSIEQDAISAARRSYEDGNFNIALKEIEVADEAIKGAEQARVDNYERAQELLEKEQASREGVENIMLSAAKNGASEELLRSIQGASNTGEAIALAFDKLADPAETTIVDLGTSKALINSQTGQTIQTFSKSQFASSSTGSGGTYSYNGITVPISNDSNDPIDVPTFEEFVQTQEVKREANKATIPEGLSFEESLEWAANNRGGNSLLPETAERLYRAEYENFVGDLFQTAEEEQINSTSDILAPAKGDSFVTAQAKAILDPTSQLKLTDISTKDNLRGNVAIELNRIKGELGKSGDFHSIMASSAGGKVVSDTFIQSFSKGVSVIDQVQDLALTVDANTGPIAGIVRGNNPYDVKAQEISARLQALVPNLARGVYGEVGVLTDNDIRLYSKTLPNLKNTDAVNQAVLSMTIRSVQRALENQIKVAAASGRDMSGYLGIYEEVKGKADSLLEQAKSTQGNFDESSNTGSGDTLSNDELEALLAS